MKRKRLLCIALTVVLMLSLSACRSETKFQKDSLTKPTEAVQVTYRFSATDASAAAEFDLEKLRTFEAYVKSLSADYGYPELFHCEKTLEGISADHSVAAHQYSALDENGKLTKEHLLEIVKANTAVYLGENDTEILSEIEDESFLLEVCDIITTVTNDVLKKYPDIDKERVYCNLGNLKIIQKSSALDFAAVEPGMVLHMNPNTALMVNIMQDASMYHVLVHETMHIIQYGCSCENVEGCSRRCGYAHYFESWEQDYADIVWLAEGSAERMASLYLNVEPMTYKTMVNYIKTIDLATMLQKEIPADYVETLCFYADTDRLFELFGCESDADKDEILHLLYAFEMFQMSPSDVEAAYQEHYGKELVDEEYDAFCIAIKSPIIKSLTKQFYRCLAECITENDLTQNDICFLVNLFEDTIAYHLNLNNEEYDIHNSDFFEWYQPIRTEFFGCFGNLTMDDYLLYNADAGENTINASLSWLDSEKAVFLLEKFEEVLCDYKIRKI